MSAIVEVATEEAVQLEPSLKRTKLLEEVRMLIPPSVEPQ